jgi:rubrerythrin
MTRLRELHEKLTADGSWPEDVPIEVEGTNIKSVLKNIVRDQVSTKDHYLDDIGALKKGIDFEAAGSKFYADLAEACDNPEEKKFFTFLSQIEREHMLSMQDSLFYLEDPEGWFERSERAVLDG